MASELPKETVVNGETETPRAEYPQPSIADVSVHKQVQNVEEKPVPRIAELRDEGASVSCSSDQDSDADVAGEESKPNLPYEAPSDELKEKIKKQIEYYFDDVNITKDAFLLKHVRRHKEGYVSLKLISSFRKVKSLTRDYRQVIEALKDSEIVEINPEATKIRRRHPLPPVDDTFATRTVIGFHLPMQNPTVEQITELFSECGQIALVRILKPEKKVPHDVRKFVSRHPEVNGSTCALVEYEKQESAIKACNKLTDSSNWRSGMHVVQLARNVPTNKKEANQGTAEGNGDNDTQEHGGSKAASNDNHLQDVGGAGDASKYGGPKNAKGKRSKVPNAKQSKSAHGQKDSSPGRADFECWRQKRSSMSPSSTPRSSPYSSPRSSPMASPNVARRRISHGTSPLATADGFLNSRASPETNPRRISTTTCSDVGSSPSGSPWIQRRLRAKAESNSSLTGLSPGASPLTGRKADADRLLRQPKGPDGTRGFDPAMRAKKNIEAKA